MRYFLSLLAVFSFGFASAAPAQDNPVVVELFTSQGCSSCPPADAIMHALAEREDVIALALHVDYWDYIGWKDPFGVPAHAERQRAYAAEAGRRTIFTPEMIVGGVSNIVGAKPMKLAEAIQKHGDMPALVQLSLTRQSNDVLIKARVLDTDPGEMTVHLLHYTPRQTTMIKRGENRGKTLDYANTVEGWRVLGTWDGRGPLTIETTPESEKPLVVIIQQGAAGPILAAARLM